MANRMESYSESSSSSPSTAAYFAHTGDFKALSSSYNVEPIKGWDLWDVLKNDQIPLSLPSLSVALLVMVLGLVLNVLMVLVIVRGLKFVDKSNTNGSPTPRNNNTTWGAIQNNQMLEEDDDEYDDIEYLRYVRVDQS